MKELWLRRVFTEPYGDAKPVKYQGHILPSYFTAMFYFLDNGNSKVTKDNHKKFKMTWSAELLLRVTKAETIEVVKTSVFGSRIYPGLTMGARTFQGVNIMTTTHFDPDAYGSIHAGHYLQLSDWRTRLTAMAVTTEIQSHVYKKTKTGGRLNWIIADPVPKTEAELQAVGKAVVKQSYTKLDLAFYKEVTRIYNEELEQSSNPKPIKALMQSLGKSEKRVQAYATQARRLGLLNDDDPRRGDYKVKKPTTRKGK